MAVDGPPSKDRYCAFQEQRVHAQDQLSTWVEELELLTERLRNQQREQLRGFEQLIQETPLPVTAWSSAKFTPVGEHRNPPESSSPALHVTLDSVVVVDEAYESSKTRHTTGSSSAQAWAEQCPSLQVARFHPKDANHAMPTSRNKEAVVPGAVQRLMTAVARGTDRVSKWKSSLSRSMTFGVSRRPKKKLWKFDRLATLVNRTEYQILGSLVIVVNAIFVGARSQLSFENSLSVVNGSPSDESWDQVFRDADMMFCAWFTLELLLNFVADPVQFADSDNWRWNLFDFVLVVNCIMEAALEGAIPNVGSYVRTLRVFRAARMLRIIRVFRVFTSLRLMVYAIMQSMLSLLWVFSLLLLLMYVFAIFFLNAANDYAEAATDPNDGNLVMLKEFYGTVPKCLYSLFLSISGGIDWVDLMKPLQAVNYNYRFLFLLFIFFVCFGVLNVVTGAFVDSFVVVSQRDRDVVIEDEIKREKRYMADIQKIFDGADTDGSGNLTLEEFESHLQDGRVKAFFQTLELDTSQARALFMLLDTDDTNEIGIDEFIVGCTRLKGNSKSIDVNMLLYQSEYMIMRMNTGLERIEEQLGLTKDGFQLEKVTQVARTLKAGCTRRLT